MIQEDNAFEKVTSKTRAQTQKATLLQISSVTPIHLTIFLTDPFRIPPHYTFSFWCRAGAGL